MPVNYQKIYTYIVGQIDDTLQFMAGELMANSGHDCDALLTVGNRLKNALLTAENMYLDQMDGKD